MNMGHIYTEIHDHLDDYVAGQAEAKQKLSALGYLYANRCKNIIEGMDPDTLPRLNMFITGPTGTGKTLLMSTLADCLQIPFTRIDCASLTQVGWEGVGLDEVLSEFTNEIGEDGFGIIVLDEFDKLGNLVTSSTGQSPNLGTQYNLLDLLDGKYSHPKVHKGINNCLIVCAGAFTVASKEASTPKRTIGFGELDVSKPINWKEVMVKGGIVTELAGRLVDVAVLKKLKKTEIRNIINNPLTGTYTYYKNLGIGLDFNKTQISKLVDKTFNSEYGLRELDTAIFNMVRDKLIKENS